MAKERIHIALKSLSPKSLAKARRTVADFKAAHDLSTIIPNRIRAALARLLKDGGSEAYAYEFQDKTGAPTFCTLSGLSSAHISQHRIPFKDHVVRVRQDIGKKQAAKFVWFATKAAATKARGGAANAEDLE